MKKLLFIGVVALATSGCSIFRTTLPDYVLYNADSQDTEDWRFGGKDHPSVWATNLHTIMLNIGQPPVTHARWAIDGAVHGAGEAAKEIEAFEKEGATFKVAVRPSGKFTFEVFKPTSASDAATSAATRFIPFASKEDYVAMMLNNVGRGANKLGYDSIPNIEKLYFATVVEIQDVKAGKPLTFDLPEGISRDDYVKLLESLLLSYDNDYQEIMNYRAALASTLAAIASLDQANRGGIANVYVVLGASLEDRKRHEQRRDQLKPYPPTGDLAEMTATAAELRTKVEASPRFTAWKNESHALTELSNFGAAAVDGVSSLSEVYSAMGGVDFAGKVQDRIAAGITLDDMLALGLKAAPAGSKLQSVIAHGRSLHTTAQKASAAVEDPGRAAGSTATELLLWATPQEVASARQLVLSTEKPKQQD